VVALLTLLSLLSLLSPCVHHAFKRNNKDNKWSEQLHLYNYTYYIIYIRTISCCACSFMQTLLCCVCVCRRDLRFDAGFGSLLVPLDLLSAACFLLQHLWPLRAPLLYSRLAAHWRAEASGGDLERWDQGVGGKKARRTQRSRVHSHSEGAGSAQQHTHTVQQRQQAVSNHGQCHRRALIPIVYMHTPIQDVRFILQVEVSAAASAGGAEPALSSVVVAVAPRVADLVRIFVQQSSHCWSPRCSLLCWCPRRVWPRPCLERCPLYRRASSLGCWCGSPLPRESSCSLCARTAHPMRPLSVSLWHTDGCGGGLCSVVSEAERVPESNGRQHWR
jgi:hypothetical protein